MTQGWDWSLCRQKPLSPAQRGWEQWAGHVEAQQESYNPVTWSETQEICLFVKSCTSLHPHQSSWRDLSINQTLAVSSSGRHERTFVHSSCSWRAVTRAGANRTSSWQLSSQKWKGVGVAIHSSEQFIVTSTSPCPNKRVNLQRIGEYSSGKNSANNGWQDGPEGKGACWWADGQVQLLGLTWWKKELTLMLLWHTYAHCGTHTHLQHIKTNKMILKFNELTNNSRILKP